MILLVALGVPLLLLLTWRLARLVATDGYGTLPPPRSHHEELGTRVDRELRR
ncbi:hypothetical protein [Aeromicrobium wangtongii]|uniref:Uncharacterized protein n=1 Tax=Aeromicrobium wangtongii TaxID=2969247 RepID=A0ABY5M6H8_9ACTN|nr:hypothetical protein [Aeromicrobium wangtongii]MCD9198539.1 hypothetical protein [Aeromicrobium wangtongii]UUP12565.1 hypothetical protein NQV15_11945 [Aeromicrobium wangtongii]